MVSLSASRQTEEGGDDDGDGVEGVGKSTRSPPGKQGQRDFRPRFEGPPPHPLPFNRFPSCTIFMCVIDGGVLQDVCMGFRNLE